jgi:23S rRNA G2069 N7-methylase RlmK/C1962 C5-methylase RlmI
MSIEVRSAAACRALPSNADGALWSARPECGVFEFRGAALRIEVPDPEQVLFPSDCGLSLLAALRDNADVPLAGCSVLDIGCGSGIYTVALLAAGAAEVTALDVNPASVEATVANVAGNGLDMTRLSCVTADLADYAPGRLFDLVITNPPHLPYNPAYAVDGGLETALVGGSDGRALYDLVIDRIGDLLAPGGSLLMAHSSLANIGETTARMESLGYRPRTLGIYEMDIPLRVYNAHADSLLSELDRLRQSGKAAFEGRRFTVHALAFHRDTHV